MSKLKEKTSFHTNTESSVLHNNCEDVHTSHDNANVLSTITSSLCLLLGCV